jgi:hypothetical protein
VWWSYGFGLAGILLDAVVLVVAKIFLRYWFLNQIKSVAKVAALDTDRNHLPCSQVLHCLQGLLWI